MSKSKRVAKGPDEKTAGGGRSFRLVPPAGTLKETEAPTTNLQCPNEVIPSELLIDELLAAEGFVVEKDPLASCGQIAALYVAARRLVAGPLPLGRSLAARFGLLYIQDRSSMLPPLALAPKPNSVTLDMCASPGSKTGQLAQMVGKRGLVIGNEPGKARLPVLRSNLEHLNLWQAVTSSYKAESYPLPSDSLEQIQLDPPCSGWGTLERNPKVMEIWQGDKTKALTHLQRALLREAARILAPGGSLVYSTCTTNIEENEEQVIWAMENLGLELCTLPTPAGFKLAEPARHECAGVWRVENSQIGSEHSEHPQGQGFFVARFRKSACGTLPDSQSVTSIQASATLQNIQRCSVEKLAEFGYDPALLPPGQLGVFGRELHFLPQKALDILPDSLDWRGLPLGTYGNSGLKPSNNLRALMPSLAEAERSGRALCLEKPEELRALLNGLSLSDPNEGRADKFVLLYYKDLPLCRLLRKGKRLLYSA